MKTNLLSNRRTFIKHAALLGGSALVMALGSPKTAQTATPSTPRPKVTDQGYRLTEHIKKYYETTRQ